MQAWSRSMDNTALCSELFSVITKKERKVGKYAFNIFLVVLPVSVIV